MSNWEFISYDVWGNEDDGFQVNAAYTTGRVATINDDTDYDLITDALISLGVVSDDSESADFEFDGDEDVIYVNDAANMYPICELRRTEADNTGALQ